MRVFAIITLYIGCLLGGVACGPLGSEATAENSGGFLQSSTQPLAGETMQNDAYQLHMGSNRFESGAQMSNQDFKLYMGE